MPANWLNLPPIGGNWFFYDYSKYVFLHNLDITNPRICCAGSQTWDLPCTKPLTA